MSDIKHNNITAIIISIISLLGTLVLAGVYFTNQNKQDKIIIQINEAQNENSKAIENIKEAHEEQIIHLKEEYEKQQDAAKIKAEVLQKWVNIVAEIKVLIPVVNDIKKAKINHDVDVEKGITYNYIDRFNALNKDYKSIIEHIITYFPDCKSQSDFLKYNNDSLDVKPWDEMSYRLEDVTKCMRLHIK